MYSDLLLNPMDEYNANWSAGFLRNDVGICATGHQLSDIQDIFHSNHFQVTYGKSSALYSPLVYYIRYLCRLYHLTKGLSTESTSRDLT